MMSRFRCLIPSIAIVTWLALTLLLLPHQTFAEDPLPQVERLQSSPVLRHLQPNPLSREASTPGEQTLAQMHVPPGFKVELIAAEPDIHQPIAFTFDDRGRIWVVEAHSYPTKRPAGEGLDRIVIFEDTNADGTFDSHKVFTEGLNLASGIAIGHGGVWIGAAPELLFIPDRNRDDVPDGPPQVMLDGFGYQDTHETLNSFRWGPDGWLYGIQGVFNTAYIGRPDVPIDQRPELRAGVWRFHPVRHEFEIFAHGGSNPWGLDYDEHGELFMTHCRSYWGRGPTTHVIQGGQFWNQVNANYAPFVIADPPTDFPELRNYLLASARYGHGAGGAGPRGSDAIYGGHSHVGTMIYFGDNWPDEYRGNLFTHNLGGHQINQQINRPTGSGFDTIHAGRDVLFCTDPAYVAVDLQYGPDGAVYIIDWVDPQHCHNPNTERWDRSNGRIYRMQWQPTYKPVKVDLGAMSDVELVGQLNHKNQWYARTARRLLHERAQTASGNTISSAAMEKLVELILSEQPASTRLNALWVLHFTDAVAASDYDELLSDTHPALRAWVIQLATESRNPNPRLQQRFTELAAKDTSPVVRRALASAIQRVPVESAWQIANALASRAEDADDRNLPFLLWHSIAPLISGAHATRTTDVATRTPDIQRAFDLAHATRIPVLADWIHWFAATLEGESLNRVIGTLQDLEGVQLHKRLAAIWLAMEPRANLPMPPAWPKIAPALYSNTHSEVQHLAERLAAVFGDTSAFPRLRSSLADATANTASRQHAFAVLSRAQDRSSIDIFLRLLDDPAFRLPALQLLARFDSPTIAPALVSRFNSLNPAEKSAALNTLTSRPTSAITLLEAVENRTVPRDQITAHHIRQLSTLDNPSVNEQLTSLWGPIKQTPAAKLQQISELQKTFNEAPLWAYSSNAGRQHFETLCASCHRIGDVGQQIGPDLTGAGKHGIRYYLENIIDPDAVVGLDFQLTTIKTRDDELISGIIVRKTASAVTLRTTVGETVIPAADILQIETTEKSLMPEGLLETLPAREQIELLKYLTSN